MLNTTPILAQSLAFCLGVGSKYTLTTCTDGLAAHPLITFHLYRDTGATVTGISPDRFPPLPHLQAPLLLQDIDTTDSETEWNTGEGGDTITD